MRLDHLLQDLGGLGVEVHGPADVAVTSVVADSRRVGPGAAFVALRGLRVDGHAFVGQALAAGAAAIVAEGPAPPGLARGVAWVRVTRTQPALGRLASALHGHPSRALKVLAVTGTNGKTTVAWLLEQLLAAAGHRPGLLGTVETRFAGQARPAAFTTPLADELQALLAEMRDAGCTHVVLEASSHGLDQDRLAGTEVAVGGFTNLTRDHIDYHGSMEAYRAAKARLFEDLARAACFNVDDAAGRAMADAFAGPRRTVSVSGGEADLSLSGLTCDLSGSRGRLSTPAGELEASLPLIGRHNVENALVALGMAELAGVPLAEGVAALRSVRPAPGRLERVPGPRQVVVDYAHTPDALANVLRALRPLVPGRLVCVFGAGGDRDRGKRPEMGRVAASLADHLVITSDNPRSEEPESIMQDILGGVPAGTSHEARVDRADAIAAALRQAGPDDLVLIAGKGHETYQIVGDRRLDFDDRAVARGVLATLGGGGRLT